MFTDNNTEHCAVVYRSECTRPSFFRFLFSHQLPSWQNRPVSNCSKSKTDLELRLHQITSQPRRHTVEMYAYAVMLIILVWSWPWPLTYDLENLFGNAHSLVNICVKFHWNLSYVKRQRITRLMHNRRTAGRTTRIHNVSAGCCYGGIKIDEHLQTEEKYCETTTVIVT